MKQINMAWYWDCPSRGGGVGLGLMLVLEAVALGNQRVCGFLTT